LRLREGRLIKRGGEKALASPGAKFDMGDSVGGHPEMGHGGDFAGGVVAL